MKKRKEDTYCLPELVNYTVTKTVNAEASTVAYTVSAHDYQIGDDWLHFYEIQRYWNEDYGWCSRKVYRLSIPNPKKWIIVDSKFWKS